MAKRFFCTWTPGLPGDSHGWRAFPSSVRHASLRLVLSVRGGQRESRQAPRLPSHSREPLPFPTAVCTAGRANARRARCALLAQAAGRPTEEAFAGGGRLAGRGSLQRQFGGAGLARPGGRLARVALGRSRGPRAGLGSRGSTTTAKQNPDGQPPPPSQRPEWFWPLGHRRSEWPGGRPSESAGSWSARPALARGSCSTEPAASGLPCCQG